MKKLTLVYFGFAGLYLVLLALNLAVMPYFLKPLPIFILMAYVAMRQKLFPLHRWVWIILALCFCALGDISFTLDIANQFMVAVFFFLVAHCFYIALFAHRLFLTKTKAMVLAGLYIYALLMASFLLPHTGDLLWPVMVYMVVLCTMGTTALLSSTLNACARWGAMIFIISDSILAIQKFVWPEALLAIPVMLTYYLAQWAIIRGLVLQAMHQEEGALEEGIVL